MSLKFWLPLTKDLKNQGLSSIMPTQTSGFTKITAGKLGECYKFTDMFDTLLPLSEWDWTTQSVSFGCWAKISKTELSTLVEVSSYSSTSATMGGTLLGRDSYGGIGIRWKTNNIYTDNVLNKLYVYTHIRNTTSGINLTGSQEVPFDTWFHIMTVIDRKDSQIKLYLNGELVKSIALTVTGTFATGTFRIAEDTWDGGNGHGSSGCWQLNDIRIYDHALSPLEVKQISQGLVLHYPLNHGGLGQKNLLKNTNVSVTNGSKTGFVLSQTIPSGTKVTFSLQIDAIDLVLSGNKRIGLEGFQNNGTNNSYTGVWITGANAQGTYSKRIFATVTLNRDFLINNHTFGIYVQTVSSGSVTISNPKIEIGDKSTPWCPNEADALATTMGLNDTIEYDCSGYGNNGTKIGTLDYSSDTPRYDVSTVFNNSPIKINDFIFTTGIWTISFWYYLEKAPTGYQCFICLSRGNGADANKKIAACPNTSYIWFKFESTSFTVSLKIQEWTHIVMTCDGVHGKVYENGILKSTSSAISSILTDCNDLVVGARSNATDITSTAVPLTGSMSDVRIYATALSPEDVLDLYNLGAAIDTNNNLYGAMLEEV